MHAAPAPGALARFVANEEVAGLFVAVAAAVLPLWDRVPRWEIQAADRLPGAKCPQRPPKECHDWLLCGGHWQCRRCLAVSWTRLGSKARLGGRACPGMAHKMQAVLMNHRGHRLVSCDIGKLPLLVCSACGAYATSLPRKLATDCCGAAGRTVGGQRVVQRVAAGLHPDPKSRVRIRRAWRVCEDNGTMVPVLVH